MARLWKELWSPTIKCIGQEKDMILPERSRCTSDEHNMLAGVKRTKGHYNRLCFIIGRNVYSLYWSRSHLKFVSQGAQNIWCFFCTRQKTSLLFCPKLNFLNITSHTCVFLWCKDVHNMKKYFWLFYMLRTIGKWGWRKSWTSIFWR